MSGACSREAGIVDAVVRGRWPDAVDDTLRAHAHSCEICGGVVTIAPALRDDFLSLRHDAPVPLAAQVWWRAAVRARMDDAQQVSRPITWAQGLAGAAALGLLVALAGAMRPSALAAAAWLLHAAGGADPLASPAAALLAAVQRSLPLVAVAALCVVIAPVALYFALSDE